MGPMGPRSYDARNLSLVIIHCEFLTKDEKILLLTRISSVENTDVYNGEFFGVIENEPSSPSELGTYYLSKGYFEKYYEWKHMFPMDITTKSEFRNIYNWLGVKATSL